MVGSRFVMEKTGDKLPKPNSQQSDLYNYNLDHVYCSDNSRYRNAGTHLNITAAASDLKALRKENKQLQAMLLLHLDLIQEQSNQLIAKDKQLIQLREENAQLRLKCERGAATNERRPNNTNRHSINTATIASSITPASTTITNATTNVGHRMLNTSTGNPSIESYFTTTGSHSDPKVSTIRTQQQQQQKHENINTKFKTINNMNTFSNVLFNNNSSSGSGQIIVNENQAVHEMRNNSQNNIFPTIKVEANTMPIDENTNTKKHTQVLNNIGAVVRDRYRVVTSSLNKSSSGGSANLMSHDKTVKYRAIENNVIGHNNGKIISKIILQRKRSENGEKIFVRTKNIEIGSNNRVNYGKWSPLRTIKSEVIDDDDDDDKIENQQPEPDLELEPEPQTELATENTIMDTTAAAASATTTGSTTAAEGTASPNAVSVSALNDEEASSDVPNTDYLLMTTGTSPIQQQSTLSLSQQQPSSLPPLSAPPLSSSSSVSSIHSLVEQSDASECHIDSIKIEQEIDDILDESDPHCMSFNLNREQNLGDVQTNSLGISPSAYDDDGDGDGDHHDNEDDDDDDDGDDEDDRDDDDDDDDDNDKSMMIDYSQNTRLDYSHDTSNIESPQASESMQCIPLSSSPVTSTVSTSDYTHCDLFGGTHFDSNSSTQTGGGGGGGCGGSGGTTTILYPIAKRHLNRNAFLTTRKLYKIREWQLDEIEMELKQEITDEICKEENEANLELPKWRTWEMGSYRDSPNTGEYEDLSDDAFVRRHARFLLDERKRKKWDVQRIREQRTIERLKRRHCKDELNQQKDMNKMFTFYPTVDQLKTIQITDDLPVSAFGEPIPLLPPAEFSLPWQNTVTGINTAAATTTTTTTTLANAVNESILRNEQHSSGGGVQLAVPPDYASRPNSNSSSANPEFAPSNVSSIIFLSKRRSGRTRTSISHNQPHPNIKCIT